MYAWCLFDIDVYTAVIDLWHLIVCVQIIIIRNLWHWLLIDNSKRWSTRSNSQPLANKNMPKAGA